ncbi:hypothetical protein JHK86_002759 [Glycine max]|nr:hypothetical protein JHK86_002759 [Glycine max]
MKMPFYFPAHAMKSLNIPRGVRRVLCRTLNTYMRLYQKELTQAMWDSQKMEQIG